MQRERYEGNSDHRTAGTARRAGGAGHFRCAVMNRGDLFERILKALHGAVLDDARWPAASGLLDRATGAKGSFLVTGEGALPEDVDVFFARFCFGGQRNVELEREYFETYHPVDERTPRIRQLPDGKVVHVTSLFTNEEMKTSLVYNEALDRSDTADGLFVRLDGPRGTRIVWAIADPAAGDGWSGAQRKTIERLLPHLRQYVRVRQAFVDAGALGAAFADLLENDRTGVIQLDRRARVAEANDHARRLLRSARALTYEDGRLRAAVPAEDAMLQKLLTRALPANGGAARSGSMALSGPGSPTRLVLHANPVDSASVNLRRSRIGALVLLLNPAHRARIGAKRVGAILGLTKAESELAVLLAQGKTIREIAAATGRGVTTLRWHLKHIFAKHGLSRQIDLVHLVNALDAVPGPRR